MPKGRGFWIQAEIAIVCNGLTSPSPRVDAPTLKFFIPIAEARGIQIKREITFYLPPSFS